MVDCFKPKKCVEKETKRNGETVHLNQRKLTIKNQFNLNLKANVNDELAAWRFGSRQTGNLLVFSLSVPVRLELMILILRLSGRI